MSRHSPGPWRMVVPHGGTVDVQGPIVDANGDDIMTIDPGWESGDDCVEVGNPADVRLIAAAPELLALARYVAERGEGGAEQARALIARIDAD